MKLSIITSYYNCLEYIKQLANCLEPQLNDQVEWLICDDGCDEKELDNFNAKVIHLTQNSGCAGIPRNHCLDIAKGEYITFIDADDLVVDNFVDTILDKIENYSFDYCLMSWKHFPDFLVVDVINGRPVWNCSVWGIVYNRNIIGDTRFTNDRIAEDYIFNSKVLNGVEEKITNIMYLYRNNPNGISATYKGE